MNRSLHAVYESEVEGLNRSILSGDKDRALEQLGIVMHYIQDVAVPAHVAPIYHVAWDKDNFDGYGAVLKYSWNIPEDRCKELITGNDEPEKILNDLAKSTLSTFNDSIDNSSLKWSDFWRAYSETQGSNDGFSTYGKCNDFGRTKTSSNVDVNMNEDFGYDDYPKECILEKDIYDDYYKTRYHESVIASLRLLIYWDTLDKN